MLEWYPRINEILYGRDHPLPFAIVVVSFEHGAHYPAFTTGNIVHISADELRNRHDSYEGMVVHELTHVVQHYPKPQAEAGWVVDGIADYVRHEVFEKDIKPLMRLDAQPMRSATLTRNPFSATWRRPAPTSRTRATSNPILSPPASCFGWKPGRTRGSSAT